MGCHTWFYRKLERTQQQAKESCLEGLRREKSLLKEFIVAIENDIDWSQERKESLIKAIAVLERKIRVVEKNLCQRAVWNNQSDNEMTMYVDGKGLFIECDDYRDLFRKYGYPDDMLFSLEETLEYINNPENYCFTNKDTLIELKEFWEKHPDGMICFG